MHKLISNFESVEGTEISFVAGKTTCAPKRFMTIPRLELQATVFFVRLKNSVVKFQKPLSIRYILLATNSLLQTELQKS